MDDFQLSLTKFLTILFKRKVNKLSELIFSKDNLSNFPLNFIYIFTLL